jgi:hypothetical protein
MTKISAMSSVLYFRAWHTELSILIWLGYMLKNCTMVNIVSTLPLAFLEINNTMWDEAAMP